MTTEQDAIIEQLQRLYLEQENTALEYHVRLLRIALMAERELGRIEPNGDLGRFLLEIIKLAEGKA